MLMEFFDPEPDDETEYIPFPMDPPITDSTARKAKILEIVKQIYDSGKIPQQESQKDPNLQNEITDEIPEEIVHAKDRIYPSPKSLIAKPPSENAKKRTKAMYREQIFNTLGNKGLGDDTLLEYLAISVDHNAYPFLSNLVDSFIRDRVNNQHSRKQKAFNALDWAETNPFIQMVTTILKKRKDLTSIF